MAELPDKKIYSYNKINYQLRNPFLWIAENKPVPDFTYA